MRKQNSRIALRLPSIQREQIENAVKDGKAKNISQLIRKALSEFLFKEEINDESDA